MPDWLEGLPTILALFGVAAVTGVAALFLASFLGPHRIGRGNSPDISPLAVIDRLASLADTAKREGLLSLEGHIDSTREPLVACAIAMAIEGADARRIGEALDAEIDSGAEPPSAWVKCRGCLRSVPAIVVMTGAALLLVTVIRNAQNPPETGMAGAACGVCVLLAGVILTGLAPGFTRQSGASVASATLCAILQARGVLLICSGADGTAVRARLGSLLPTQDTGTEQVARAA